MHATTWINLKTLCGAEEAKHKRVILYESKYINSRIGKTTCTNIKIVTGCLGLRIKGLI